MGCLRFSNIAVGPLSLLRQTTGRGATGDKTVELVKLDLVGFDPW